MNSEITSTATALTQEKELPPDQFSSAVNALIENYQEEGRKSFNDICTDLGIEPNRDSLLAHHKGLNARKQGRLLQRISRSIGSARRAIEFRMKHPNFDVSNDE
ncbi:MAG: hypothetical protein K9M03_02180 [Kiritimatiellales bacterium]|nr:hypothetical protein [Kiritimatiellales bacterium]